MTDENAADVIIIGGGIAGCSAGYHLARRGYDVLLIEREPKAHHKVCGEFLSPETIPYLNEMGIDLDVLQAAPIKKLSLYSRHFQQHVFLDTPARGLSRYVLDEACLQSAMKSGCRVSRGVRVDDFTKKSESEPFVLQTSQGEMKSKTVFLATGKHALKKINHREGRENSALGFKMHLHLSERGKRELGQDIALFFFRGGYAGLSAAENGIINLCFIVNRKIYHEVGNSFESVLVSLKNQNPKLKEILADAIPLWQKPLAMADLPYGFVFGLPDLKSLPTGLYPLGDQFAVIPSLTGSGMAIALYTAHKAVAHYHQKNNQGVESYVRDCSQTIGSRMRLAYPLHAITRFPFLADASVYLLNPIPQMTRYLLTKTRMPAWQA